mgnify:CR=1 FL=1
MRQSLGIVEIIPEIGLGESTTLSKLDSARDRIDFWLALRGRELISPTTERIR